MPRTCVALAVVACRSPGATQQANGPAEITPPSRYITATSVISGGISTWIVPRIRQDLQDTP